VAVKLPVGKPFAVGLATMLVITLIGLVLAVLIPRRPVETAKPTSPVTAAPTTSRGVRRLPHPFQEVLPHPDRVGQRPQGECGRWASDHTLWGSVAHRLHGQAAPETAAQPSERMS
jgi:hypothetical protein